MKGPRRAACTAIGLLLLATAVGRADPPAAPSAAPAAPPVTCAGESDPNQPVVAGAGRKIFCALDLGSKNAKLQVISIEAKVKAAGPTGLTSITPSALATWFKTIVGPADYAALRSPPVRDPYGEKALANTVLLDLLVQKLGLSSISLVPQEMPAGYILAKLR